MGAGLAPRSKSIRTAPGDEVGTEFASSMASRRVQSPTPQMPSEWSAVVFTMIESEVPSCGWSAMAPTTGTTSTASMMIPQSVVTGSFDANRRRVVDPVAVTLMVLDCQSMVP